MGGGCHGIVTGGTSAFGEDMGVLADRTIVAALAAYPISRRGSTFNRWFNASLAVDHLEATTGHDRIDLETRVLEWALEHAGGYELVTFRHRIACPLSTNPRPSFLRWRYGCPIRNGNGSRSIGFHPGRDGIAALMAPLPPPTPGIPSPDPLPTRTPDPIPASLALAQPLTLIKADM